MPGQSTPRTIGHVLRAYLPRSETFVHTLLRHQRRWRPVALAERTEHLEEFPLEHVVELRATGGTLPERALRRLRAYAAGTGSAWDHRLAQAARVHGCAALHAHFGPMGCRALGARERLELPLVTTFYGFDLAFAEENPDWREPYRRLFERGDAFVCEGPFMAERLAGIGAPRERVRVVRIGLDLAQFPFEPRRPARPLVVIQTGRFSEKKGFDLSVRAFARARPEMPEAELWLVGDGEERPRLEALVEELAVGDSVRFLGMLSHAEYRAAMAGAHVGIQPSRTASDGDTEGGAPTVLLEMQAAGMPLVATRHADIPAVVARPEELVPEDDADALATALVAVATAPAPEWRRRAEEGRALVEREHDARVTAARVEALYDELAVPGA